MSATLDPLAAALLLFVATAAAVGMAGARLARDGDIIAARTRLGGVWVGSVFLAVATSLPELMVTVSAARIDAADIAAGNLFGSSMANMLVLALITMLPAGASLFRQAALDHALAAGLAIVLNCLAGAFLLARLPLSVGGVGAGSLVLLATYLLGARLLFRQSALAREATAVVEIADAVRERSLPRAVAGFVVAAAIITAAAPLFARSAEQIAELTGLGQTVVGTWLVGLATSLPEFVTSLAALRIGAFDLAVGNLFGSNAINMVMFVPLDVASGGAPVFASLSPVHAISAFVAIALMGMSLVALVHRARRRFTLLEPSGLAMVVVYVCGLLLVLLAA